MRRAVVSLTYTVAAGCLALALAGSRPATAQSSEGLCRVLTVDEVGDALGPGEWRVADDGDLPEQCSMANGLFDERSRALSVRLLRSNEENQQEFRADMVSSGAVEIEVAGLPALQDRRDAVTVFFPDPWDILQLSPVGAEDEDVSAAMRGLAELAAAR